MQKLHREARERIFRVSSGTGNVVSLAFPESCNAPNTSRTPQLQDYVSLSFSLRVLSCGRAPILPREGGFSLAINKEREERLRAEMYLVLLILGKFQWMHCGNPEGMEIRRVPGEGRFWRTGRQLSESCGALNTSILTYILFRSFLCSFHIVLSFVLNIINGGIRTSTSFFS